MKIYLCARFDDVELFKAWQICADEFDNVITTKQGILDLNVDAVVAPANSFGDMTGGLDLHYRNIFGIQIEQDIQSRLAEKYYGELPVGMAEVIKINTSNTKIKYVIFAPTMRVPESVGHTINSFLAAKAALIKAKELKLKSIAFPGLGTGTGSMKPQDCAKQLATAIKYVLIDEKYLINPKQLYEEQILVRGMASEKCIALNKL